MKRNYEQPQSRVIRLNVQSHLCVVSQIGPGEGNFDVKTFNGGIEDPNSTSLKQRDLWGDEW